MTPLPAVRPMILTSLPAPFSDTDWLFEVKFDGFRSHIDERGEDLFKLTVERDLEGIVGKWKRGAYIEGERPSWVKIRNRNYSQIVGRDKIFERRAAKLSHESPSNV